MLPCTDPIMKEKLNQIFLQKLKKCIKIPKWFDRPIWLDHARTFRVHAISRMCANIVRICAIVACTLSMEIWWVNFIMRKIRKAWMLLKSLVKIDPSKNNRKRSFMLKNIIWSHPWHPKIVPKEIVTTIWFMFVYLLYNELNISMIKKTINEMNYWLRFIQGRAYSCDETEEVLTILGGCRKFEHCGVCLILIYLEKHWKNIK